MVINISVPESEANMELKPKITVVGIGGAGGNAVNNMIEKELGGVEFVAANTDSQALKLSKAGLALQLGAAVTEGLGAGSKPDIGRLAAEESLGQIMTELENSHMIFIAAGMGGGTGTGAAPVIAKAAKERGILTVAVVTKPFQFEGSHRMRLAEAGIKELEQYVDTLIIIPNQNLFRIATEKTTFADAFAMADEVLYSGVRGITDLMVMPGLINLDFADIRTVMAEMGKAMMGTGEASGERRALDAAEAAIANPLLDDMSMLGAKGVLINITGGADITLFEVDEAANHIRGQVDEDAYIIIGSAFDKNLDGVMRVSVVATGIDVEIKQMVQPNVLTLNNGEDQSKADPLSVSEAERNQYTGGEGSEQIFPVLEQESGGISETINSGSELVSEINESENSSISGIADENSNTEEVIKDIPEIDNQNEEYFSMSLGQNSPDNEGENFPPESPILETDMPTAIPNVGSSDVFIPEEPEENRDDPNADKNGDPFKLAELANGSREMQDPSQVIEQKSSLFELVTGSGKAAIDRIAKVAESVKSDENVREHFVEPVMSKNEDESAMLESLPSDDTELSQPYFSEIDPKNADDDDLLDIPAFLRRQAN